MEAQNENLVMSDVPDGWMAARTAAPLLGVTSSQMRFLAEREGVLMMRARIRGMDRLIYRSKDIEALVFMRHSAASPSRSGGPPQTQPTEPQSGRPTERQLFERARHIISAYCNDVITPAEFRTKIANII